MPKPLSSARIEADGGWLLAVEQCWERGWTDGLPVIPPVPERVQEFLEYIGLEPDEVVAEYQVRARAITAEKAAINAVMAGCKPEYFPVVIAACKAVVAKPFALNHIASMGSPWPLIIVNGPQVKALGFNSGTYVFGTGTRANATVGRALSLILANCMEARIGGIQRGTMGHPCRYGFCVAENEDTSWEPLHVERGFAREDSVVTVFPSNSSPLPLSGPNYTWSAEQWAQKLAIDMTRGRFSFGANVLAVSPYIQNVFDKERWSKQDLRRYIMEHAYATVAYCKRMGIWLFHGTDDGRPPIIEPEDEARRVYLFKSDPRYRDQAWQPAEGDRKPDILIIVAGGDAGAFGMVVNPYPIATEPVSQRVEKGRQ